MTEIIEIGDESIRLISEERISDKEYDEYIRSGKQKVERHIYSNNFIRDILNTINQYGGGMF